jgi:hypothetical protein
MEMAGTSKLITGSGVVKEIDGTPPVFLRGYWIHVSSIGETTPSFIMPVIVM